MYDWQKYLLVVQSVWHHIEFKALTKRPRCMDLRILRVSLSDYVSGINSTLTFQDLKFWTMIFVKGSGRILWERWGKKEFRFYFNFCTNTEDVWLPNASLTFAITFCFIYDYIYCVAFLFFFACLFVFSTFTLHPPFLSLLPFELISVGK